MAKECLEFEYQKKFEGIEFHDMHDSINKVDRNASLLRDENQKKTTTKKTYYKNPIVNYADFDNQGAITKAEMEVSSAEVNIDKTFMCKELIRADNSKVTPSS